VYCHVITYKILFIRLLHVTLKIEIATKRGGGCPAEYKARALAARSEMEQALKKHIENSRISETGLRSARARARVLR
jgi:hypothetical protein